VIDFERGDAGDYLTYAGALRDSSFSISCWYKPESAVNNGIFRLYDSGGAYYAGCYIQRPLDGGSAVANTYDGGSLVSVATGNDVSTAGAWHCVQASFSTSDVACRADSGTWVTAGGGHSLPGAPTWATEIARHASSMHFDGQFADFLLIPGVHGVAEVDAILDSHAAGFSGRCLWAPLLGLGSAAWYWPFWSASHLTDELNGQALTVFSGSVGTLEDSPPLRFPGPRRVQVPKPRIRFIGSTKLVGRLTIR